MHFKRKCVLYIAISLDGYIADEKGDVKWLDEVKGDGKDNGYAEFLQTVDTLIMGRKTYDQVLTFGEWGYKGKECYVFSRTKVGENENVIFVNQNVVSFIAELKKRDGKKIWLVGGATLVTDFLNYGLIDEYIITMIPTILGQGIPLFQKISTRIQLTLEKSIVLGDMAQLYYVNKK